MAERSTEAVLRVSPERLGTELAHIIRDCVLDAFKLGVGHAVGVLEERYGTPPPEGCGFPAIAQLEIAKAAQELRVYAATVTYEELP